MKLARSTLCASLFAVTAIGGGCATVETERPQLTVTNSSRHLVETIRFRQCADPPTDYTDIPNTTLRIGHSVDIEVHDPCIDVLAVDENGRVLGQQDRLRIPPKATWLIR
jgi:hypothetical protein